MEKLEKPFKLMENNTLLKYQWVTEEIKKEIKRFLDSNEKWEYNLSGLCHSTSSLKEGSL
jgi:hypothetical protein